MQSPATRSMKLIPFQLAWWPSGTLGTTLFTSLQKPQPSHRSLTLAAAAFGS